MKYAVIGLSLITLCSTLGAHADELSAVEHYDKGYKLYLYNVPDNYGATQQGLLGAEKEIKKAISLDYRDKKAAEILLLDIYVMCASRGNPEIKPRNKDEQIAEGCRREFYRLVKQTYDKYPDDEQAIRHYLDYAHMQRDRELKLKLYSHLIKINPEDAEAHFNVAILYSESGNLAEAVTDLREAIAVGENPRRIYLYALELFAIYTTSGCVVDLDMQSLENHGVDISRRGFVSPDNSEEKNRAISANIQDYKNYILNAFDKRKCN